MRHGDDVDAGRIDAGSGKGGGKASQARPEAGRGADIDEHRAPGLLHQERVERGADRHLGELQLEQGGRLVLVRSRERGEGQVDAAVEQRRDNGIAKFEAQHAWSWVGGQGRSVGKGFVSPASWARGRVDTAKLLKSGWAGMATRWRP